MWATEGAAAVTVAQAVAALAVALGCGLLVGIERERRKGRGVTRALAGVRTFALVGVLGAAATVLGQPGLVAVGALLVAALGVVSHARDRSRDPGVTTEVALLLTYLIGVLCVWSLPLGAGLAVALTALLAARDSLHRFARQWLQPGEVRDGIVLGALVLIALPLMPDRPWWGEVLNPYRLTQLLALLLWIQALAHLGRRLLEARQAVVLASVASGFVSSTAAIASAGMMVREGRGEARLMAGSGLLSCVATLPHALVVAIAIQPGWVALLWGPVLAGTLVALLWGLWLVRGLPAEGSVVSRSVAGDGRLFSWRSALLVAALLAGMQGLVYALRLWLGTAGVLAATLLAAALDLHAALAAVWALGPPQASGPGVTAVMLALAIHGVSKAVTAGLAGGWRYLAWLVPGLAAHTLAALLVLALWT